MKKTFIFIGMLIAFFVASTSCSNEAKEKYEVQKAYVDSLHKANKRKINRTIAIGTPAEIMLVELQCEEEEAKATDSLVVLAKEAFGDKSKEYEDAKNR